MDCLSKDQLLLLQDKLSFTEYENFIGMFEQEEKIPENPDERNRYIIETMKNHKFWGEIHGWGNKRVYKHIPKYNESRLPHGPYGIFSYNMGSTKKELIKFLDGFSWNVPFNTSKSMSDCMPVEETFQVPMYERWMNDSMGQ
mgnify:CR=1 FL=1